MKQVPRDEVSILCTQARNDREQLSDHLQESRVELSDLSACSPSPRSHPQLITSVSRGVRARVCDHAFPQSKDIPQRQARNVLKVHSVKSCEHLLALASRH